MGFDTTENEPLRIWGFLNIHDTKFEPIYSCLNHALVLEPHPVLRLPLGIILELAEFPFKIRDLLVAVNDLRQTSRSCVKKYNRCVY